MFRARREDDEEGFVGVEIKASRRVSGADARTLRGLDLLLDKPLLGAVVVSQDLEVRYLAPGVLAVPAAWFLSPPD